MTGSKMAFYDQFKSIARGYGIREGMQMQLFASLTAGFLSALCVTPFDTVRTRLMNQPTDAKLYDGMADCCKKMMKTEGPLSFYKGFVPIYARIAPTTTLQLMAIELLRPMVGLDSL